MNDPRLEAAAVALYEYDRNASTSPDHWPDWQDEDNAARGIVREAATAALAAADNAATITTYTGAQVNKAGWVCGACEPGDYAKCEDCRDACDDVAQFVNRLIGGTE